MKTFLRSAIIPTAITVLAVAASFIAPWYYWDSGLYSGGNNIQQPSNEINPAAVVLIIGVAMWLKYFLYERWGKRLLQRGNSVSKIVFWGIYTVSALFDLWFIFTSFTPVVDAGLAVIGIIAWTPYMLAGGLVTIIGVNRFTKRPGARP